MNDQQILEELEAVLEALGIRVRYETLDGSAGGICTLNGRCCMFLDAAAQPADKASMCARAVRAKADLDAIYLKPEVRRYLEQAGTAGCGETGDFLEL